MRAYLYFEIQKLKVRLISVKLSSYVIESDSTYPRILRIAYAQQRIYEYSTLFCGNGG